MTNKEICTHSRYVKRRLYYIDDNNMTSATCLDCGHIIELDKRTEFAKGLEYDKKAKESKK